MGVQSGAVASLGGLDADCGEAGGIGAALRNGCGIFGIGEVGQREGAAPGKGEAGKAEAGQGGKRESETQARKFIADGTVNALTPVKKLKKQIPWKKSWKS